MVDNNRISVEQHGLTCVVHVGPEYTNLDDQSLQGFQDRLLECSDLPDTANLVVDLSHTDFFGTSFLEVLFRVWNRIQRKGGNFALSGLKPYPKEVIRVSKLDKLWRLCPNVEAGIKAASEE